VSCEQSAKRTHVRYWILLIIFIVTTVNYADRATLSVTGPAMRAEFGFSAIELGYIFSAFSWAYVAAQLPGGWLLDKFGARRVYAFSIFFWSLFALRFLVGLAGSIFNMFGNIAGIVTPIVIGYILAQTGSFNGALMFVGLNALVTVVAYLVIVKDIKRMELKHL